MSGNLLCRPFLTHIPHAQLLVSAGGDEERSIGAPGQRLDNVVVPERELGRASLDIPEFDSEVTRGTGEDILSGGVEENMADFPKQGVRA